MHSTTQHTAWLVTTSHANQLDVILEQSCYGMHQPLLLALPWLQNLIVEEHIWDRFGNEETDFKLQ